MSINFKRIMYTKRKFWRSVFVVARSLIHVITTEKVIKHYPQQFCNKQSLRLQVENQVIHQPTNRTNALIYHRIVVITRDDEVFVLRHRHLRGFGSPARLQKRIQTGCHVQRIQIGWRIQTGCNVQGRPDCQWHHHQDLFQSGKNLWRLIHKINPSKFNLQN